jgi:nitroreductase
MNTLDAATLRQALEAAEAAPTLRDAAAALRTALAPLRVVVVDAHDMRHEAPAALGPRRAIYLGASDGHCWQVTQDPARAAGVFVADRA